MYEMTKEDYIKARRKKTEINFQLCWQYWNEVKPKSYNHFSLQEFSEVFKSFILKHNGMAFYISENGIVVQQKVFLVEVMQEKIFDYFDEKYSKEEETNIQSF